MLGIFVHLMLEAAGLNVLVVGGGAVAARKAGQLLTGGARITLLSPGRQEAAWQKIAADCQWLPLAYDDSFALSGYDLVIAATNQPEVNRRLAERCRDLRILCNCASCPEAGEVALPGVVAGRTFSLAVSSGGRLPLLTRRFKRELGQFLAAWEEKYNQEVISLLVAARRRIVADLADRPKQKQLLLRRLAQAEPAKLLQKFSKRTDNTEQAGGNDDGEYDIPALINWLQGEQAGAGADQNGGGAD